MDGCGAQSIWRCRPVHLADVPNWLAVCTIALGRKNWLFAGSEQAGKRAAAIMSLLATAKANGVEPHAWLIDVLERLPTTKDRDIDSLLPHRWEAAAV